MRAAAAAEQGENPAAETRGERSGEIQNLYFARLAKNVAPTHKI